MSVLRKLATAQASRRIASTPCQAVDTIGNHAVLFVAAFGVSEARRLVDLVSAAFRQLWLRYFAFIFVVLIQNKDYKRVSRDHAGQAVCA